MKAICPRTLLALLLVSSATAWTTAEAATWGGETCASSAELRQIVDDAFAQTPAASAFPGRGSSAPGYSAAVLHDDCGLFTYAVGRRRVEVDRAMRASTRQHIGSLTKSVTTALTLILADQGLLGDDGIEATVKSFFSSKERRALKKGIVPGKSLCPARIVGFDRVAGKFAPVRAKCPRFSKITVRELLNGNHGLWDFLNEVDRDGNGLIDFADYIFADLLDALGAERSTLDSPVESAFDVLTTAGVLVNKQAEIGRTRVRDFELSFGNTGYQLLGVLLEKVSGESYDALVEKHVVSPLGLNRMALVQEAPRNRGGKLATPYAIVSGAEDATGPVSPLFGETLLEIYPIVDVNGHPAIDAYAFEPLLLTNGGGGAGGLSAAPRDYVRFFHALVTGGLLAPEAQALLDSGFLPIEGTALQHGFALFSLPSPEAGRLISKGGQVMGSNCIAYHALAGAGGNGATAVVCRNSVDLFLGEPATGTPHASADVRDVALELLIIAIP